jgi:large subunit ribosomal protein L5
MAETKGDKGAKPGKGDKPAAKGKPDAAPAAKDGPPRREAGSKSLRPARSRPRQRYVARLKKRYQDEIVPKLTQEFGYKNALEVPRPTRSCSTWALAKRSTIPRR